MSGPETFDLHHQFAPSVLATYLGAASIISAVETLFDQEQQLSVRFLHFWFNSFSAAVSSNLSHAQNLPCIDYAINFPRSPFHYSYLALRPLLLHHTPCRI
jgi:hypothetical protein